ncbi:transcriptional repressor NF-X1-like isoform X2 [Symsagittifera roscoffensis]|uniref:transcriptional repressor NF-X1-like isoform X2 n=1 Tax=Symsagittifera roscoffensis TaxID=84072 RepID=UPI00307BBA20
MYGERGRGRYYPRDGNYRPPQRYFASHQNRPPRHQQYYGNYYGGRQRFPVNDNYMQQGYPNSRSGSRYGANYEAQPLQTYFYTSGVAEPQNENNTNQDESGRSNNKPKRNEATSSGENMNKLQPSMSSADRDFGSNADMAEKLTAQLSNESYECMICCDSVKVKESIWSCTNCYHVFHLHCIQEWSRTVLTSPNGVTENLQPPPELMREAGGDASTSGSSSSRGRRNMMISDVFLLQYMRSRNSVIYGQDTESELWNASSGDVGTYLRSSNSNALENDNLNSMIPSGAGWRCPGCQFMVTSGVPKQYRCFCGKLSDPGFTPGDVPHTCGEMCGKKGKSGSDTCEHPCTLLCHPGPCPPCVAMTTKQCDCGKQSMSVRCDKAVIKCDKVCGRDLSCKKHQCEKTCHRGSCGDCTETVDVACFCARDKCTQVCTDNIEHYSCKQPCGKTLNCGNHKCEKICHSGDCGQCETSLDVVKTCPCGKFNVSVFGARLSCLDKVPTCNNPCGKVLKCGPHNKKHRCQFPCHLGPCPVCPLETQSRCRCGANTVTVPCQEIFNDGVIVCTRVCKRKLHCNKHQCRKLCCVDSVGEGHVCAATCNRLLSCGVHQCQENCHRGNCERCWQFSFEDLTCHCGQSRIPAPVPCGTSPPTCDNLCMRQHPCGHPPQHTCHSDEKCPPCPVLIAASCLGEHHIMNSVPCYIQRMSCGRPCGKGLPNCDHLCTQTCHSGTCLSDGQSCQQKCQMRRFGCGHACNERCHYGQGDCPDTPCKQLVPVSCVCGRVKGQLPCHEYEQRCQGYLLQSAMSGLSVSSEGNRASSSTICYQLPCKDSCKRDAWLRKLDDAFGPIENNMVVPYTDNLIQTGTTAGYGEFIYELEKTFFHLVQSCVDTGMKQQYAFKPMNATKRRIVHELADFYGLDSQSYDEEPMKHVVVFGYRNRVKIPDTSLTSVISKRLKQASFNAQSQPGVLNTRQASNVTSFPAPSELPGNQFQGPDADGWTVVGSAQHQSMIRAPGSQQQQSTQQNTNNPQMQSTSLGNANWASNFPLMNQNDSKANQANNPYSQYSAAVGMSFSNATNLQQQQNMNQWNPNIHYGGQISFQNVAPPQPAWQQPSSMAATVNSFSMSPSSSFDFGNLQMDSRSSQELIQPGLVSLGTVRSQPRSSRVPANNQHVNNLMSDHFED